ncbi:MAG: hypothetical protein ACFFFB_12715 [Candidatus Heimdallarchaeota archaeon]
MLELEEWAELKKAGNEKGPKKLKEELGLKNYKLKYKQENNYQLENLYEHAKYNPKYCEELEAYLKKLEVLKAYQNLLYKW